MSKRLFVIVNYLLMLCCSYDTKAQLHVDSNYRTLSDIVSSTKYILTSHVNRVKDVHFVGMYLYFAESDSTEEFVTLDIDRSTIPAPDGFCTWHLDKLQQARFRVVSVKSQTRRLQKVIDYLALWHALKYTHDHDIASMSVMIDMIQRYFPDYIEYYPIDKIRVQFPANEK